MKTKHCNEGGRVNTVVYKIIHKKEPLKYYLPNSREGISISNGVLVYTTNVLKIFSV